MAVHQTELTCQVFWALPAHFPVFTNISFSQVAVWKSCTEWRGAAWRAAAAGARGDRAVDVPGPFFHTRPTRTSVFSNLLPSCIILGANCRKKQLKKEIHSEVEVVMFNSALRFGSWTAGALSGLSFIWSPGKAEVTAVKTPFFSAVDGRARGYVEPGYCTQPCVQLSSQCCSETF